MAKHTELPCTIEEVVHVLGIPVIRNTGTQLYCRCPFCDDHRAHMNVKLADNVFRCYRCGKGGGVLHLYATFHNISLAAAGDELRSIFGEGNNLRTVRSSVPTRAQIVASEEVAVASAEVRDNTYSNLLSLLTLAPPHREALQKRGLSNEDIEWAGYRTTPAVRTKRIVSELQERGCVLEGVPGFYSDRETGRWVLDIRGTGIMIPDRNAFGQIEAIQIRLDKAVKSKFNNLTSAERYYGTPAHCCPHFVGVDAGDVSAFLTEGVMKADIAHRLSLSMGKHRGFVGLTGVANKSQLKRALQELEQLGVRRIYLAFDSDFQVKKNVHEARDAAISQCVASGFEVIPLTWDCSIKGIDDLLLSYLQQASAGTNQTVENGG